MAKKQKRKQSARQGVTLTIPRRHREAVRAAFITKAAEFRSGIALFDAGHMSVVPDSFLTYWRESAEYLWELARQIPEGK